MPTYVYKFVETGETIEVQQAFTDEALTEAVHPTTGRPMAVKKVFTPVGVTFKGDGFYKTDSRNGAKRTSGSSGTSSDGESSGASSGTTSDGAAGGSATSSPSTAPAAGASSGSSSSSTPAASGS